MFRVILGDGAEFGSYETLEEAQKCLGELRLANVRDLKQKLSSAISEGRPPDESIFDTASATIEGENGGVVDEYDIRLEWWSRQLPGAVGYYMVEESYYRGIKINNVHVFRVDRDVDN